MIVPDDTLALARIADAPAIADLSRTLIETGLPWSWVPRRVAASIRHPETNVLVARVREGIAGFGIMRYGLEEAHLNLFAVDRAWRGQGVGRRLLEWPVSPGSSWRCGRTTPAPVPFTGGWGTGRWSGYRATMGVGRPPFAWDARRDRSRFASPSADGDRALLRRGPPHRRAVELDRRYGRFGGPRPGGAGRDHPLASPVERDRALSDPGGTGTGDSRGRAI